MTHKQASLKVLYEAWPSGPGGLFVQVRQWESGDGEHGDMVLEFGAVSDGDELTTQARVLPFYLDVDEVLALLPAVTLPPLVFAMAAGAPSVVAAD